VSCTTPTSSGEGRREWPITAKATAPSDEVRAFVESEGQMWEGEHLGYQPKELIDAGDEVEAVGLSEQDAHADS
jgi:hypothetical protein